MNLISIRFITDDVQKLAEFYEKVIGIKATFYTKDFAELKFATATLAIGSTRTLAFFGGNETLTAAQNRSAIIEFQVADVDKSYADMADFLKEIIIQKPTTMPWGNRSLLFCDPDGNVINFFTPVTSEAMQKFAR